MGYPQMTFTHTTFHPDSFISRKRAVVFKNTIPYQLHVLKETGTYDAFKLQWRDSYKPDPNSWIPRDYHLFWDSDIGKWIEGACYSLHETKDVDIAKAVDELVDMIAKAQEEDGYLNIHYQVVEPEKKFSNLRDMHELYNAGHLIEAAIAHHALYKNEKLLGPMLKYVKLLYKTFGPGDDQLHGYPGHPEIELALLRLHSVTNDPKHIALAQYFIDERGNPTGADGINFYNWEAKRRGERPYERPDHYPMKEDLWYQQAHKPIVEQDKVMGHAVRAMYLLTGVADYQKKTKKDGLKGNRDYDKALATLWSNMVNKRMYLTGGIGAMGQWEGFGADYFAPQSRDEGGCYAETCASIGVMMLAQRLLQINLDSKYADIMELCFYNSVLGGMSSDGKTFAYENALASCDASLCKRQKWFTCACCPPNVSRILASIGGYIWDFETDEAQKTAVVNVHMFASASLNFKVGDSQIKLTQTTNSPGSPRPDSVKFELEGARDVKVELRLRIPSWADSWTLSNSDQPWAPSKGYVYLDSNWTRNTPTFSIALEAKTRFISPHPYCNQHTATVAKGPIIYCVEDVDNAWVTDHFKTLILDHTKVEISEVERHDNGTDESYLEIVTKGGCSFLQDPERKRGMPGMATDIAHVSEDALMDSLHFVPFYFRANRGGRGHMRVGIRKA